MQFVILLQFHPEENVVSINFGVQYVNLSKSLGGENSAQYLFNAFCHHAKCYTIIIALLSVVWSAVLPMLLFPHLRQQTLFHGAGTAC